MSKFAVYAGHGGTDPGAVSGNRQEKVYTLAVMKAATARLRAVGHEVINNRESDTERSITKDAAAANSAGVDATIEIHLNSNAGTPGTGCEAYYISGNSKGKNLAEKICSKIEALGYKNRGAKTGTFSILKKTSATAVLVETAFINNSSDMDLYDTDKMGAAIAQGILDVYGSGSTTGGTAGYTAIMGTAKASAAQMQQYLKSVNAGATAAMLALPAVYLSQGEAEGIRGDIAFAQSCLETGNFKFEGSAVTFNQNNFCGMGVTSNGMKGNSFSTPAEGILAQVQHLKGYATSAALNKACVDPRYKYISPKGCAPYVEWLGQKENPDGKGWATGAGYGGKILTIMNNIASGGTGADTGGSAGSRDDEDYALRIQKELNRMGANLVEDNIAGSKTIAALPILRRGSTGEIVVLLQQGLIFMGHGCGSAGADGQFGSGTETAVKAFQAAHGLTVDGVAGPKTWTALIDVVMKS